jgi:hypothetical protein
MKIKVVVANTKTVCVDFNALEIMNDKYVAGKIKEAKIKAFGKNSKNLFAVDAEIGCLVERPYRIKSK